MSTSAPKRSLTPCHTSGSAFLFIKNPKQAKSVEGTKKELKWSVIPTNSSPCSFPALRFSSIVE